VSGAAGIFHLQGLENVPPQEGSELLAAHFLNNVGQQNVVLVGVRSFRSWRRLWHRVLKHLRELSQRMKCLQILLDRGESFHAAGDAGTMREQVMDCDFLAVWKIRDESCNRIAGAKQFSLFQ